MIIFQQKVIAVAGNRLAGWRSCRHDGYVVSAPSAATKATNSGLEPAFLVSQAGTEAAAARLDATLVAAYLRLAEGFAAEPGHADRDPWRAAEVRDGSPCRKRLACSL
jgi:hypothetical protein